MSGQGSCCAGSDKPATGVAIDPVCGMAVDPELRNAGVGGKLVDFAESTFAAAGPRVAWCNARNRAVPFYLRHGYAVVSEEFDVPGIGPHRVMVKRL